MILVQEQACLLHWTLWSQQAILKALELKQGPGYDFWPEALEAV